MGIEKLMEDAIISDPRKYIDEKGLEFIARQYHVGRYIFDLLFEDRHGGKLLVELQAGTLDRNHTYKILDYYNEYKDTHPDEFIDLMVIANTIPPERKRRLTDLGVAFREISRSEFFPEGGNIDLMKTIISTPVETNAEVQDLFGGKNQKSINKLESIELFIRQAEKFREAILANDKTIKFMSFKATEKNPFVWFWPMDWEISSNQLSGVHIAFCHFSDRAVQKAFVRLNVGVEKPIAEGHKRQFKDEVVAEIKRQKIYLAEFDLWPNAGVTRQKTKLIEIRFPLNEKSWTTGVEYYRKMERFNSIVADKVEEFKRRGYTT